MKENVNEMKENVKISKRQVKAIIDTLKLSKRSILTNGIIQDGVLNFIGNGYFILTVDLYDSTLNGKITFKSLEVWYKLAVAKDYLTVDDLVAMTFDWTQEDGQVMDVLKLYRDEEIEINSISFNPKYLNIIARFLNNETITLIFAGKFKPVLIENDNIQGLKGLLVPVRTSKG